MIKPTIDIEAARELSAMWIYQRLADARDILIRADQVFELGLPQETASDHYAVFVDEHRAALSQAVNAKVLLDAPHGEDAEADIAHWRQVLRDELARLSSQIEILAPIVRKAERAAVQSAAR